MEEKKEVKREGVNIPREEAGCMMREAAVVCTFSARVSSI